MTIVDTSVRCLRTRGASGVVTSLALLVMPQSATTQTVIEIAPEPTCASCSIEMRRIVTLGEDEGEGFVDVSHTVVTDGSRVFLVFRRPATEIHVFSIDGTFQRVLGREGDGPGEFRTIQALDLGPGDSLYAFDSGNARVTIFSPELDLVRSTRFLVLVKERGALVGEDGALFINGPSPLGRQKDALLHLLNADGSIRRSFEVPESEPGRRDEGPWGPTTRRLARGPDGHIWVNHYAQLKFEEFDSSGELLKVFQESPPWWVEAKPFTSQEAHAGSWPKPNSLVKDLAVDDDGLVWILSLTPDANWASAVDRNGRPVDLHRYVDSILEVIDPRTGRMLLRRMIDPEIRGFAAAGIVWVNRQTVEGFPRIDLLEVRLEER